MFHHVPDLAIPPQACEALLVEIVQRKSQAEEKQQVAIAKGAEIEEQNKVIAVEKVIDI